MQPICSGTGGRSRTCAICSRPGPRLPRRRSRRRSGLSVHRRDRRPALFELCCLPGASAFRVYREDGTRYLRRLRAGHRVLASLGRLRRGPAVLLAYPASQEARDPFEPAGHRQPVFPSATPGGGVSGALPAAHEFHAGPASSGRTPRPRPVFRLHHPCDYHARTPRSVTRAEQAVARRCSKRPAAQRLEAAHAAERARHEDPRESCCPGAAGPREELVTYLPVPRGVNRPSYLDLFHHHLS